MSQILGREATAIAKDVGSSSSERRKATECWAVVFVAKKEETRPPFFVVKGARVGYIYIYKYMRGGDTKRGKTLGLSKV